ncbi:uncharacterized protein BJ212DRAFT_1588298 [Suillus subaureus]|uniref:Crinkler effector protein N-terminal domain-containing protein n=1 Tax=Suillus subaureus TaxID=48587 RepID=A0A9P7JCE0_9AGAM|nr:uncharacterized protein BJ212DRAFT_1588298 [Suillus subaureus]KAG1814235.1 hypothetical protein BJ212DRAFT_1588298 [Suillus subaureus]
MESYFTLNCLILGDDPSCIFSVKINEFDGVDACRLKLWKVDINPEKEKLDLPHDANQLKPLTRLLRVAIIRPEDGHLHIFVQPPTIELNCLVLGDDPSHIFSVEIVKTKAVGHMREAIKEEKIYSLCDVAADTLQPWKTTVKTLSDNELTMALSAVMPNFFTNEADRASKSHEILQEHDIDLSPIRVKYTTYNTDDDKQYRYFRPAIAQVTNEIGSTEAEPHMQALSCYIHSTSSFAKDNPAFRFPCIVVTLFGKFAVFDNSRCTDHDLNRAVHRLLSRCLEHPSKHAGDFDCFYHHTDTKMRTMVARHVRALRKALQSLSECYKSMLSSTTSLCPDPHLKFLDSEFPDPRFPYPYSYTCMETSSTCHFTYCHQIDTTKPLFSVKTTDGITLCVKFVRRYSKEAHQRCASGGFAPVLHGFEKLPGGWYMIVMEMITEDYCRLWELFAPYPHHDAIATVLRSLHLEGYVHGDIRKVNIMVKRDLSPGFKLMDFDWSGVIGEVQYPMNVFRGKHLWRPDGAEDGRLILVEHDIQTLHAMFPGRTFI